MSDPSLLTVRGAHEHNLRHVDLDLPRDALIVVTGVSGSGKSSLAFDTLFREGQRRYLETFPSYARQLMGKLERPAVEHVRGLSPALAVDQRSCVRSPRSTVGTMSELHPLLRLLWARVGEPHCAACGEPLASLEPESLAALLDARFAGRDVTLLAQVVDGHKGAFRDELSRAAADGFTEARVDGDFVPLSPLPALDPAVLHQIDLPVARLAASRSQPETLEAVERTLRLGGGVLRVLCARPGADCDETERFSTARACGACGAPAAELGPRLFSFNSPYGACPACSGLGVTDAVDPELIVGDATKSLRQGALVLSTPTGYIVYSQVTLDVLDQVCRAHGFTVDVPWKDLTDEQRRVVLFGSDRLKVPFGKHPLENRLKWKGITARPREEDFYKGIVPTIEEILKRNRNENALRFVRSRPCAACHGTRLRPEALAVKLAGRSIAEVCDLPLDEAERFLSGLCFQGPRAAVASAILGALRPRLATLRTLGLGYLTLARESTSLSGGEAQRLRLATQANTGLRGVLYVLDEPSIGLHSRDTRRLLDVLGRLRDLGNTVLVVEHDEEVARAADWIVDIGPGAGRHGGQVLYSGPAAGFDFESLRARREAETRPELGGTLLLRGARHHNLQGIDVPFRLGALNVVVGVSGAGKSSLVADTLACALRQRLHGVRETPGAFASLEGAEAIDKIVEIDQAPIGRTPRSNPATYTGLTDPIRDLFAALPTSKERGFNKSRFSFNVKGGRCEACGGAGVQAIGMHFLADVEIPCEECGGRRFNDETLEVKWTSADGRALSIGDVLELTVDEALAAFADEKPIRRVLEAMRDVGLGYLSLGQPATTLSGGEAQRVKLSSELGRASTGRTLYVLDEPTTGLHARDVRMLVLALRALVSRGNTVIAVEHHPDLLASADWEIELGPEGGTGGGRLLYAGVARPPQAAAPALGLPRHDEPARGISLRGVTTHNLQRVNLDIPDRKLTVLTGLSGSGKSSLAFDTLFHEGQRRFTDSLASYVRRYVPRARPAELEEARGLSPAIAVGQQAGSRSPRSTVGTLTEIYDDLRLLYSRAGTPGCPTCQVDLVAGSCPRCGAAGLRTPTARDFSFNHVQGACPRCKGLGLTQGCDPGKLVTDPSRSLFDGALAGTKTGAFYTEAQGQHLAILEAVGAAHGVDFHRPWSELDARARELAMTGTGETTYDVVWRSGTDSVEAEHAFRPVWKGFVGYVDEEYQRKCTDERGEALLPLMRELPCEACRGERLKPESRAVRLGGKTLGELCRLPASEALGFLEALPATPVLRDARAEACGRLRAMVQVGLDYLALDRRAATLSGGEAQRLRLASQLDSGLRGVTYVLDEPTVGLHPRDTRPLLGVLRRLCDEGNTVVVVEHDPEVMRAADHLVDLGPGAGVAGGRIVAAGTVEDVRRCEASATGRYLRDPRALFPEREPRTLGPGVSIHGARANNLRLDCEFPSGGRVAVTGVSGSGKSSLVFDVLLASARAGRPVGCESIRGLEHFRDTVFVDQAPIGGGAWSTPATFLGVFDPIRELFAKTPLAKKRRWTKNRFSLSGKGGRCEACQGSGRLEVRLDFLPDVWLPCESCRGARYSAETLEVTFRGRSIAEVLALTVAQAREVFADQKKISRPLAVLDEAGLGYVALGQPVNTLSGGEGQRLRLAADLCAEARGPTLYLFDEPTTGLHPGDVARLVGVFDRLVDEGHTLVVVEHNLDVIRTSDFVLDLGPGGGPRGGTLVASGGPDRIARIPGSATGEALREDRGT